MSQSCAIYLNKDAYSSSSPLGGVEEPRRSSLIPGYVGSRKASASKSKVTGRRDELGMDGWGARTAGFDNVDLCVSIKPGRGNIGSSASRCMVRLLIGVGSDDVNCGRGSVPRSDSLVRTSESLLHGR